MISVCTDFVSPSSFLTAHLNKRGDDKEALASHEAPLDAASYQVPALNVEPSHATAMVTGQPPRNEMRTVLTPALAPVRG